MLSILGNRKIIVSVLTIAFLIVGIQGVSYAQARLGVTSNVSPTSVAPNANFTLTATVRNTGTAQPSETKNTVTFYKSSDAAINASDEELGTVIVGALGANASRTVSISMPAPSNPTTHNYGAGIGGVFSRVARLTVTNARPDLTVSLTSNYNYNYNYNQAVPPGGRLIFQATVRNTGDGPSDPTTLQIEYRGPTFLGWSPVQNATIQPSQVQALNPNEVSPHTITLSAPTTPGPHYYRVYVVRLDNEADQTPNNNNYSTWIPITTASADLVVGAPTVDKSTVVPGESFELTVTVSNNGFGNSSADTTLQFYSSTDSTIDPTTDTAVGTSVAIGTLSGSSSTFGQSYATTSTQTISLTAPTTPGTYYYGAHVRSGFSEINRQNNTSTAVAITVSAPPDLVVELFDLRGSSAVAPRERLTLDATVRNDGEGQSPRTILRFYESVDRRFRIDDEIDRVSVGTIASNGSSNVSLRLIAPDTPGTYYYRVEVDVVANEEVTHNNTSGYIVIIVESPLILESVQPSKSEVTPGERFTLTAIVRNDGTAASNRAAVEFYSSDDDVITSRDTSIGTDSVSVIAARGTGEASRTLNAPDAVGTYYYGACIGDGLSVGSCQVVSITVVEAVVISDFERPPIYWVDADDGTLQSLTDSEVDTFVRNVRNATAIAVDTAGGKVYWTQQTGTNAGRILRANLDGSGVRLVRALNNIPQGIAVDASNGKLYVTNSRGKIQRMNLDSSEYEPDFIIDLDSPRGIVVDAAGSKIYWTEQTGESTGRIGSADLDGSNVASVRELNNVPYGIAVDASNGKLYVTNSRGKIQRMNLDGKNFEWNFITNLDSPNGIAVDVAAGKIYWTEAGKIRRANLNGGSRQDVVTGIGSLAGIALSVAPVDDDDDDDDAAAAPKAVAATADATALHANYPNPFNPETWIPYQLQHAADVTVTIYDLRGTIVRQLLLGHQPAGVYHSRSRAAHWDGRNNLGEPVASGLYFYTLTAGDFTATRKMLIRK